MRAKPLGRRILTPPIVALLATTSLLAVGVNAAIPNWYTYAPPFVDTAFSAPGATTGENSGFLGSTTSTPVPDANRDASGNVKSLPSGEAGITFCSQLPPTNAQRVLTWQSQAGGTNHGCGTMSMTQGYSGTPVVDLVNRTVTYTPLNTADGVSNQPPTFVYTPVSTTDYAINFSDLPVAGSGGIVAEPLYGSLISAVCSPAPIFRLLDWVTVNRCSSPIWLGQASQPATSVAGKTISSITFAGTTATLTTSTAHGLLGRGGAAASASITVSGATPAIYNAADAFVNVISPTQFQYQTLSGIAISSITFSGTTATLTTATAHGLSTGATISVLNAAPSSYNVTNVTITVTSTTSFTYTMASTPATNATSVGVYAVAPTGNASVVGSYAVGDVGFQFTGLHYPIAGSEPGTQLGEAIYTSSNRNRNGADALWHDGVQIEKMISLFTERGISPYYPMSPNCDATFRSASATLFATFSLTTGKPCFMSFANEVWNSGFKIYHQTRNEANLRGTLGDALPSCRLIATTNITLSGLSAIDGITPIGGDRILVIGQTTASQNGVYVAASGSWSRAADTIVSRSIWLVSSGLTSAQTSWFVSTSGTITLGTTALTIAQIGVHMRYAEKLIEAADAFITAFTSAGVLPLLNIVAEWQGEGSPNVWDDMAAFVGATNWAKVTHLSCGAYYGDNGSTPLIAAGIGTGYTGSTSVLKAAIVQDQDRVLGFVALHAAKAAAMGKKFITYEGGQTLNQSDQPYKTTWQRSADMWDLELRFHQQLELRVATLVPGGITHLQYNLNFPFSGSPFAWGYIEGLTIARTKAAAPKYQARVDFIHGVRALADQTGTFQIPVGATNGSVVGTATHSALGSVFTLSNSSSGLFAINSTTGVVTVANATLYTAGSSYTLAIDETLNGNVHTTTLSVPALSGNTTAYRYYRIYTTDPDGIDGFGAAEIELSETVGGVDTTAGQTYTSSTNFSGQTPDKAFDDNIATEFTTDFVGAQPYWLKVDYGATSGNWKKINQIKYTAPNNYTHAPTAFSLQGSNDNSTWIDVIVVPPSVTWTAVNQVKTFTT